MNKVYQFFIENTWLEDSHKADLMAKRGFTPETIERYKFRSAGSYINKMKDAFLKKFSKKELLESKVFTKDLNFKSCLLKKNIIIPYHNETGIEYLRPHHNALSETKIPIFKPLNFKNNNGILIITEGEFKAVACEQLGLFSIGIHGICSYSSKKFNELLSLLSLHKVKKVVFVFDNEVKDDPSFTKYYKPDPNKRNDVQFWSYYMSKLLSKNNIDALIATMPDEWRIDGGIDIDKALASGKTKKNFVSFLKKAVNHTEYLKQQPENVKSFILKRNKLFSLKKNVYEEFGHYVVERPPIKKNDLPKKEIISNFLIQIKATYKTPEGIVRQLVFKNESGKMSSPFFIEGNNMIRSERFAEFCLSQGNYIWKGTRLDLSYVWEKLFLKGSDSFIEEYDHIGYIKELNLWLFNNMAIKDDKIIEPDEDGIIWLEEKGIKPLSLIVRKKKDEGIEHIPILSTKPIDFKELHDKLSDTMGLNNARLSLGWLVSVFFMEEIFKKFRCFPFFFIHGKTKSGKTTIAQWLMWMMGIEGSGKQIKDTTSVGFQRYLSYFSSYPVFADEYRNTKDVVYKDNLFRSAYNREAAMKGIKYSDHGLREGKIRGTLLFTGEDLPHDSATLSRCLYIFISSKPREKDHYGWFMEKILDLSYFSYYILTHRSSLKEKFFKIITDARAAFLANGIDNRTSLHFAICAAGYHSFFGFYKNTDFHDWMKDAAIQYMEEQEDEHVFSKFWSDIEHLLLSNKIKKDDYFYIRPLDSYYCIYFRGLYNEWEKDCRSRGEEISIMKMSLLKQFKEEDCFIGNNINVLFADGKQRKCLVIFPEKAPDFISDLFQ